MGGEFRSLARWSTLTPSSREHREESHRLIRLPWISLSTAASHLSKMVHQPNNSASDSLIYSFIWYTACTRQIPLGSASIVVCICMASQGHTKLCHKKVRVLVLYIWRTWPSKRPTINHTYVGWKTFSINLFNASVIFLSTYLHVMWNIFTMMLSTRLSAEWFSHKQSEIVFNKTLKLMEI